VSGEAPDGSLISSAALLMDRKSGLVRAHLDCRVFPDGH